MTIWSHTRKAGDRGRRVALLALWGALPLITLGYQICAKRTAELMGDMPFDGQWLMTVIRMPWAQALLALEVIGFVGWMAILAEMKLSAAFPLSAVSYILVVGAGWLLFHEPISLVQIVGSGAILTGVWLIGADRSAPAAEGD